MSQDQLLSILVLIGIAPITGSFLGVLFHRIPAGRKIGLDRSACDDCGHILNAIDLLPVVTWLFTRGRCRYCGVRISAFYPAIELAALGLVLWAWTSGTTGWQLWTTSILGWNLMTLVLINRAHFSLPGAMILIWPMAVLGLAVAWLAAPQSILDHLIGAAIGFGVGKTVDAIDDWLGGRLGLDGGGAALLAACGAWLAWQGMPDLLVLGLVLAGVAMAMAKGGKPIPGGATVAVALWLVWLYGPVIVLI